MERGRPEVPEGKGGSLDTHMEFYFDTYTLMSSESHWPINITSLKCFIESHLWHIYKLFFSLAPRESNDEKLYFSSAIEIDEDDKSYLVLKCFQVIKEKKLSSSNIVVIKLSCDKMQRSWNNLWQCLVSFLLT